MSNAHYMCMCFVQDEEAGSPNNPRGLHGGEHVMREGFRAGGGAIREVVAYKLDRGFAEVPPTAVDKLLLRSMSGTHLNEQKGSIQQFVESVGDAGAFRFDGSDFDETTCQRMALQDVRLFNCDRHEGNVLVRPPSEPSEAASTGAEDAPERVPGGHGPDSLWGIEARHAAVEWRRKRGHEVVPIDHAFCLPSFGYFREAELVWQYWVAAKQPFSDDAVAYAAAIDVDVDVAIARRVGLSASACATLRVTTMLIQRMMRAPLAGGEVCTPLTLARMILRTEFDVPSPLERMCARALGIGEDELHKDTALISHVRAAARLQQEGEEQEEAGGARLEGEGVAVLEPEFVPPPEFFARFAAQLDEELGAASTSQGDDARSQ